MRDALRSARKSSQKLVNLDSRLHHLLPLIRVLQQNFVTVQGSSKLDNWVGGGGGADNLNFLCQNAVQINIKKLLPGNGIHVM